ncbi:helix-turn-helix transcriptional regulator [Agrobacterium tumefaciens]|uniref:helix-turn-helix transcriptional regulator n=1 Tax=Agrobacterium tumefaciens TaxID=358 RepID=UPI003D6FAA6C
MRERIIKLRHRLEWSQARMAKELGVSQPTIWRIEHGRQEPSKSVLKLLEIFEARLKELTI